MFEVTGDPDRVLREYAEQFDDRGFPVAEDRRGTDGGSRIRVVVGHTAGGGSVEATHLEQGGRDWLLITRCND